MRHVAICLALLVVAGSALAQVGGTGSIQGTVTDPSGAVVAGASVTATNVATGVQTARQASDAGFFVLPLLQPGEYTVAVKATGFQTLTQQHVVVNALAIVGLNVQLNMGTATETVTVEVQPTLLKTDDVALGSSIENQVYDALPLAMNKSARDPSAFVGLSVGVNSYSTQPAGPSTGSFNGGQPNQNEGHVEGLPLTSAGTEGDTRNLAFGISVEAVEQFQVETTGGKAMYEGQGVSNYVVKSGTNQFHGGVYEYFRNTVFDAKGFFGKSRPPDHQNEFGFNFGGAIKKNKLFFFGNYDGYRYNSATQPNSQSIPTAAERTGDFSALLLLAKPQVIYDPSTTVCNSSGVCTRTAFPGNIIPVGKLSSVSKSFQSYLPTNFANSNISGNYVATLSDVVTNNSTTDKVDYNFSDKQKLFVLYSHGKYANPITGSLAPLVSSALPVPYTDGRGVIEYSTLIQVKDTYSLSSNLVNTVSWGLNRLFIPLTNDTIGGNYPTKAGLTGMPAGTASTAFPDVFFTGSNAPIGWAGGTTGQPNSHTFTEAQTTYNVQDNVLWSKGKHIFTFGFQWQSLQDNENFSQEAGFTFAPDESSGFNANGTLNTSTGNSYASYLLGAVHSSTVPLIGAGTTGGRYKTYAAYVQDDFKVTPRLTLNLGLRWDIWGPFTEVNNVMTFFNPTLPNPVAGNRPGALQFAGNGPDGCNCSTPIKQHNLNLGPRVGLAYRVRGNTAIRSFFGIFYAHAGGVGGRVNGRQGLSQIGFNSAGNLSSIATGRAAYSWDSGYPGSPLLPPFVNPSFGIGFISAAAPGAAAIGAGPSTAQTLAYGDPVLGGKPPYYEDWTLEIQHSFSRNMSLSVAYTGSAGHFLPGAVQANQFINQIPLKYLPLGALLLQPFNPANLALAQAQFPEITTPFPNFVGNINQALRPFPQYAGLANPWLDLGNSAYNALQVSANRRISNGLTFMVNYTFSKEFDDLANVRIPGRNDLERSLGTIDHTHVIASTFLYQLPFGHGHRWSGGNRVVGYIIGNWQLAGIYTFASGAPLSIVSTACQGGGIIDAVCYPNFAPGFVGSVWQNGSFGSGGADVTTTHYLNSAAFVAPTAFTAGNVPRTAAYGLRVPHIVDTDLSVRRDFPVHESLRISFQADAFNIFNEVHFAAPGNNINAANFGTFAVQANSPRKLQFSARVTF